MSLISDEAEAATDVMTVVHSLAPLLFKKETEMRGERRKGAGRERIQTPELRQKHTEVGWAQCTGGEEISWTPWSRSGGWGQAE